MALASGAVCGYKKKFALTRCATILQSALVEHSTYIELDLIRHDIVDRFDRHDTPPRDTTVDSTLQSPDSANVLRSSSCLPGF